MVSQSFQLVMQSGPNPGKTYGMSKTEMVIGRDIGNDIVINDAEVSRKHARLHLEGNSYVIEDLGSTNGTFVNGQRLMGPHTLRPGELIMFGETISLVFEATAYDPNATVAAGQAQMPIPPPAYQPAPEPVLVSAPIGYNGQVPPGPEEMGEPLAPAKKSNTRTWILAGCGCLLLLVCVCGGLAYAFDSMGLYCTPPFDIIFSYFGFCPP